MVILEALKKSYGKKIAVDSINLVIEGNLIISGESGAGKSTLARLIAGLESPDSGNVKFQGLGRGDVQIIFQDPLSSLDPLMQVKEIISEGQAIRGHINEREVAALVEAMHLSPNSYPSELSIGECQRVAIARSLLVKPKLLILDEAFSALDLNTKFLILTFIKKFNERNPFDFILISHDSFVIKEMGRGKMITMEKGRIKETVNL